MKSDLRGKWNSGEDFLNSCRINLWFKEGDKFQLAEFISNNSMENTSLKI